MSPWPSPGHCDPQVCPRAWPKGPQPYPFGQCPRPGLVKLRLPNKPPGLSTAS